MGRADARINREDLKLLHEALAFMRKRVFDQADLVRIRGVTSRIEDLLLDPAETGHRLRLSPPEQETLERQITAYCDELTGRFASPDGQRQAARLRVIIRGLSSETPRKHWLRRILGL